MTIDAMRLALSLFCDDHICPDCPLGGPKFPCGFGVSVDNMSDEKTVAAYETVFLGTEPAKTKTGIKDSGERTTFASGAVRDMHAGKGRMDLLPWEAIIEVSKHCEEGALKYGEHNVDKGIPIHSLVDSGARHLGKYIMGETDEPHLRAAAWNLLWAIYMEIRHPELQDLPTRSNIWEDKTESGLLEE